MDSNSLYLVDSSIYVFHAWYARPDSLRNRQGEANNAFLGFVDFTYRFLSSAQPRHIVFAFDQSLQHSHRKDIYPQYKANRSPAPAELKRQFQWCRDWVDLLGISQVASTRYEADDLIGTLTEMHRQQCGSVVIVTADKDLAQLVREEDSWYAFHSGQQLGYRALQRKFGVRPEQIADLLALAGDKVDNIPGIPGIGMAIAARLLTRFETVQNLRANLDEVASMKFRGSARVMQLLKTHQAVLDISTRLTPVFCEVEDMQTVAITRTTVNSEQMMRMLDEHQVSAKRRQDWYAWALLQRAESS